VKQYKNNKKNKKKLRKRNHNFAGS